MHLKRWGLVIVLFVCLVSCSSAPPAGPEAAKALIEDSAKAMGGWANIDAVKAQEILTGGGDWEPMQSLEPKSDPLQVDSFAQTILVDLDKRRMRLTHVGKANLSPTRSGEVR